MDANAPEWIKLLVTEMRAFLDRQERFLDRQERRDAEWRQEQQKRDTEWQEERKQRDSQGREEQEKRDERHRQDLKALAQAARGREERFLHLVEDTRVLQIEMLALHREVLRIQRDILKQASVTHALLRDILKTLRLGRNGHGRGPSRN